jgi:hypothetical protein
MVEGTRGELKNRLSREEAWAAKGRREHKAELPANPRE